MKNFFVKKIFSAKTIKKLEKKMNLLGKDNYNVLNYLASKLIATLIIFAILSILFPTHYLINISITIIYYLLSDYICIERRIINRKNILETETIEFLEVLLLVLENKTIKQALEITVNNIDNSLSKEFKKCLNETQLTNNFEKSLKNMKERIPSRKINNIILYMIETIKNGGNLKEELNYQLNDLYEKKNIEIITKIKKIPVKISLISAIFIVPIILLIILSPIIINMVK